MSLFIDPAELEFAPLIFLFLVYGYILFYASNLISDGSELLLLVPALAGVVGSVVLPVLGAVPDGAIVLFSGMGPDAQENLNVGVGALAGSTIMLLTIPWGIAVISGRVNIEGGEPNYKKQPKLQPEGNISLCGTGVSVQEPVRASSYLMLLTALSYFLIQGPAFVYQNQDDDKIKQGEHEWALYGTILSTVFFIGYLYYQMKVANSDSTKEDKINEISKEKIMAGEISLLAVVQPQIERIRQGKPVVSRRNSNVGLKKSNNNNDDDVNQSLMHNEEPLPAQIKDTIIYLIKPFFKKYDIDRSGCIEIHELSVVMSDLGFKYSEVEIQQTLTKYDTDNNGDLDFEEFSELILDKIQHIAMTDTDHATDRNKHVAKVVHKDVENGNEDNEDDNDEEEEEEIPEDLKDLSPEEQQYRIKLRAFYMMTLGTALVLLFSDPMVDVLSAMGDKTGIPAFYIAFVLCPLASNASELIAAANYASKKTSKSINISLSALTGAACMNNTFCLAIFLILIYFKELEWEFSAETISILAVEVIMGLFCFKKCHTVFDALLILAVYPLSIAFVYVLENVFGMN